MKSLISRLHFFPAPQMNLKSTILVLVAISGFSASPADSEEAAKPLVFVPAPPYEFLIEKIAGELVTVKSICGPNDDPHDYSPTPRQLVEISSADLLFSGELGFESNFFVKVGDGSDAPRSVSLLDGLPLLEGSCDHPSHRPEASDEEKRAHVHEDLNDPHVWLSPTVLSQQTGLVAETLKELLDPSQHAAIDENAAAFRTELAEVDRKLKRSLGPLKGTRMYVYHGAFAYFARDYGLEQIAVQIGGRGPTPKQLINLSKQAIDDGVKLIFVQPQFDQTSAKALAKTINGKVVSLDPLERNILENLRFISDYVIRAK